nr:Fic family protein [uncultured Lamprocystis sp.]
MALESRLRHGSRAFPVRAAARVWPDRSVSIHPFEDANRRMPRAIAEHLLVQGLGQPTRDAPGPAPGAGLGRSGLRAIGPPVVGVTP